MPSKTLNQQNIIVFWINFVVGWYLSLIFVCCWAGNWQLGHLRPIFCLTSRRTNRPELPFGQRKFRLLLCPSLTATIDISMDDSCLAVWLPPLSYRPSIHLRIWCPTRPLWVSEKSKARIQIAIYMTRREPIHCKCWDVCYSKHTSLALVQFFMNWTNLFHNIVRSSGLNKNWEKPGVAKEREIKYSQCDIRKHESCFQYFNGLLLGR